MTVYTIRAHRRFAVSRPTLVSRAGVALASGLLVELSLEGCRISRCEGAVFAVDEVLTITPTDAEPFEGRVRWQRDAAIGLRLVRPFHTGELETMLRRCRNEPAAPLRAYGT